MNVFATFTFHNDCNVTTLKFVLCLCKKLYSTEKYKITTLYRRKAPYVPRIYLYIWSTFSFAKSW